MDPEINTLHKRCNTCRKSNIPDFSSFKNCGDCREKSRLKSRLAAERKRASQKVLAASIQNALSAFSFTSTDDDDDKNPDLDAGFEGGKENGRGGAEEKSAKTPERDLKRKGATLLRDLEGNERKAALKEMRLSLNKSISASGAKLTTGVGSNHVVDTNGRPTEVIKHFQTASAMYEALISRSQKAAAASTTIQFRGCHAIVADPTIDNMERVSLVAEDLRKFAKIPFGKNPSGTSATTSGNTEYFKIFSCDCFGTYTPFTSASQKKSTKRPQPVRLECGGQVTITSLTDESHPGISGQKIIVRILH